MSENRPISPESHGESHESFRGGSESAPARPRRIVSLNRATERSGSSHPAVTSANEAAVVYERSKRRGPEAQGGCIRYVEPGEPVKDGLLEWLLDLAPITYGQLDELKKQGLPRPKNNPQK